MANPSYIDEVGELIDGEAWVFIHANYFSSDDTSAVFSDPADASSKDWSQFMDLVMICSIRDDRNSTSDSASIYLGPRGGATVTGTVNYSMQRLYSYGGAVSTNNSQAHGYGLIEMTCHANNAPANRFGTSIVYFYDINSGKHKAAMGFVAAEGWASGGNSIDRGWVHIQTARWKDHAPIGKIDIRPAYGTNFKAGTRFDLDGILPRMVS